MDIEKGPLSLAVRLGDSGKLTLVEWGECIHVGRWGGLEQKCMYLALDVLILLTVQKIKASWLGGRHLPAADEE